MRAAKRLAAGLLTQGNAFNSMSQTAGSSFAGPALGGVIVAAGGTAAAFAIDAASFAVSAGCLLLMSRVPAPRPARRSSVTSDIREGLRWTVRQRWLWFGILAVGVANFAAFSPTAVTIPLMVRNVLHQGPAAYGATFATGGLGAAVVAGRFGSPRRRMSAIWTAWARQRSPWPASASPPTSSSWPRAPHLPTSASPTATSSGAP